MRGRGAPGSVTICLTVWGLMASRERVRAPQHRPRTSSQVGSSPEFRATSSGHPIQRFADLGKRAEAREHPPSARGGTSVIFAAGSRALPAPALLPPPSGRMPSRFRDAAGRKERTSEPNLDLEDGSGVTLQPLQAAPGDQITWSGPKQLTCIRQHGPLSSFSCRARGSETKGAGQPS